VRERKNNSRRSLRVASSKDLPKPSKALGVEYPSIYENYGNIYLDKPFQRLSVYPSLDSIVSDITKKKRYTVIAFAVSGNISLFLIVLSSFVFCLVIKVAV
jgi:hypothetical protein